MLRINGRACECGERLELEGRLTRQDIAELEKAVMAARLRAPRVSLDVSELTYLDSDGATALRELQRQEVEVHGCSAFVAEVLGLHRSVESSGAGACWK